MKKIKLDISYLGSAYCGWQVQPNKPTVQKFLQNSCEKAFGSSVEITGCSRTDSGVHAKSFICTADLLDSANNIPEEKIPAALNVILPPDIYVKSAEEVSPDFHPRYSAKGKEYEYIFCDRAYKDPFLYGRAAFVGVLDEKSMDLCAKQIEGEHDFACFMASGSKIIDTVRTVYSCRVERRDGLVVLTISANGFLYNMVRIIAGTLLECGRGKMTAFDLKEIIASKDRSRAGRTMPAQGLYLNRVFYGDFMGEESEE